MPQLFKNNAFSALAAAINNTATTLTVTTGHGDRFPAVSGSDFFMLTLQDAANNVEIVRVTARTAGADSMTIVRAQEGFSARSWNIGDVVELRVTAFALNPLAIFAGASTAQTMRDAMDVPSRNGGNASGTWSISISGNAATATQAATAIALQTARSINGVNFNGTADITLPTVNTSGNQTISGTKTFSDSVVVDNVSITVGKASTGAGGNVRHKRDDGTVQWVAGILGSAGSTNYEWYNSISGAVRLGLDTSGNLTAAGNVTAFSDERLKKDWAPVQPGFLERLTFVKRGTYTRTDTGERQAGVSAQDFKRLLPEVVPEDDRGFLSLAYGNAALVAVIELTERVLDLEARLAAREG